MRVFALEAVLQLRRRWTCCVLVERKCSTVRKFAGASRHQGVSLLRRIASSHYTLQFNLVILTQ